MAASGRARRDLLREARTRQDRSGDRPLTLLLEHLEKTRLASAKRPRKPRAAAAESRHIPSAVKRAVWARDAGRCAFVGGEGRCAERRFPEFHHVVPYASGGAATPENIQLCRAHNQYEADEVFGSRDLFVRERPQPYAELVRDSVRTELAAAKGLWKLPDLWTRRAAPTRSLENAQNAFSTATTGPNRPWSPT